MVGQGGLLQLVALGKQDVFLTGNPQMTWFKMVYRRYTNFAIESQPMYFDGTPDFGKRITCLVPRRGDLLSQLVLEVELPPIYLTTGEAVSYVNSIGHVLIQEVSIEIGEQEIDKQTIESKRWDMLHYLIGSADGKKLRNFAQGLTFDLMISYANRQLHKMSDRYLLIRDESQPLELNVVDNYQAGRTRSTKNLSGGESFIVSLTLALGLSQMSSQKVRLDSLFLDEGFGTLDEDALEI